MSRRSVSTLWFYRSAEELEPLFDREYGSWPYQDPDILSDREGDEDNLNIGLDYYNQGDDAYEDEAEQELESSFDQPLPEFRRQYKDAPTHLDSSIQCFDPSVSPAI